MSRKGPVPIKDLPPVDIVDGEIYNYNGELVKVRYKLKILKTTKKCGRCQIVKPRSEFWNNRARHDVVEGYCKICKHLKT